MGLPRHQRLAAIAVAFVAIGLSACGDDGETVTPSATDTVPTTGAPTATTIAAGPTTTAAPTGRVLEYAFDDGDVTGPGRVSVKLGEEVTVRVVSDVAEEVHVHTYDLTADLEPGVPGEVTFVADIPGVHEVELEGSHLRLLSLEVQ